MSDAQSLDTRAFRDALGRFATGVAVVSAVGRDGAPIGMTINSFASVSLEPPLVLWSLDRGSPRFDDWLACSHYAIGVLSEDQVALSNHFATPSDNKFAELEWRAGAGGAPLLPGMQATFECANETRHDGGDHVIFLGRVEAFDASSGDPLLFVGGQYAAVRSL